MFQRCPLCQQESIALIQPTHMCIGCRMRVCTKCFDAAGNRCKRCAPAPPAAAPQGLVPCGSCKANCPLSTPRCLNCFRPTCAACVRHTSPEGLICTMCPLESHQRRAMDARPAQQGATPGLRTPVFGCARCFRTLHPPQVHGNASHSVEFCFDCGRLLCQDCVAVSLVAGRYVCATCCPRPPSEIMLPRAPPMLRQGSGTGLDAAPPLNQQVRSPHTPVAAAISSPGTAADGTAGMSAAGTAGSFVVARVAGAGQVSMCVDNAELQRRHAVNVGDQIQFYTEDQDPSAGFVEGFTASHLIVRPCDENSRPGSTLVQVDPGFVIRDPSPVTPVQAAASPPAAGVPGSTKWKFSEKQFLARGGQGEVHKCTIAGTSDVVVTKEMKFNLSTERTEFDRQLAQAMFIRNLKEPHLIKYLDVASSVAGDEGVITIVTPYYNEKDLKAYIGSLRNPMDEQHICSLSLQVGHALAYLHEQNPPLVHRDVKPENILMCNNGSQALLMDLDTCRAIVGRGMTVGRGTMEYMAPECISGVGAGVKCDIWSLGVVMFVLAALPEYPMLRLGSTEVFLSCPSWTDAALRSAIIGAIKARSRSYSKRFVELIVKMLKHDQNLRPTTVEVINELAGICEDLLLGQSTPMTWDA